MRQSGKVLVMCCGLLLWNCVQSPEVVDDTGDHDPHRATVVTLANADSLLDAHRFGIVEFYSSRCPVCASLVWVIDSLAGTFADSVLVGAENTDNDTLYKRFSISSVPTYLLFKDGAEVTRRSFIENKPEVLDTLCALLAGIIAGSVTTDTGDTVSPVDTSNPSNYVTLTTLTFDTMVLRHGSVAMVFFLYAGGSPCIYMDSVVKTFAHRYDGSAVIAKVHAWDQYEITQRYNINSVPRFLFFKDSALAEQKSGVIPGDTLTAILDRLLANPQGDVL